MGLDKVVCRVSNSPGRGLPSLGDPTSALGEAKSPFKGRTRGQFSEAASTLEITIQGSWPSHGLGLWDLSLCQHSERPPRLKGDPWEAGSGKCHEMDPPYSQTGGRGVGVVDPGEAKRSPEPWGQCWSNTILGRVPESGDTPGTRPHALVWPGKVSGQHHDPLTSHTPHIPSLTCLGVQATLNTLAKADLQVLTLGSLIGKLGPWFGSVLRA